MFSVGPRSASSREIASIVVMGAMVLGLLVYWSFARTRGKIGPEGSSAEAPGLRSRSGCFGGVGTEPSVASWRRREAHLPELLLEETPADRSDSVREGAHKYRERDAAVGHPSPALRQGYGRAPKLQRRRSPRLRLTSVASAEEVGKAEARPPSGGGHPSPRLRRPPSEPTPPKWPLRLRRPEASAKEGESSVGGEAPEIEPWRPRTAEEISPEDAEWLIESEREDEAERAKFLPMLEQFKPLRPDAVRVYRALAFDRVSAGVRPRLALPPEGSSAEATEPSVASWRRREEGVTFTVVGASSEALTVEGPDGARRRLAWADVPPESMYSLARALTPPDGPGVRAKELVFLAQLAGLAGKDAEAGELRAEAARRHFRSELVERARDVRPSFAKASEAAVRSFSEGGRPSFSLEGEGLTAVGAGDKGLDAEGPDGKRRLIPWKDVPAGALYELALALAHDRSLATPAPSLPGSLSAGGGGTLRRSRTVLIEASARDALHLSRLAALASAPSEAAGHASKAVELNPDLRDEVELRPQVSPDVWILDQNSWAWDPADTRAADARTANNLEDDSPSILHLYRYMRTVGTARLREIALREPSYMRLLKRPLETRGRVFRIRGRFIRRYKPLRFTRNPEHREAGIREIDFFFLKATDAPGGVYLVSVPTDTRAFGTSDFIGILGVYLRRWPYERPNGNWKWIPWITAIEAEKIRIPSPKGWGAFILGLLVLGVSGAIVLFFAARREWGETIAARDRLHARRRVGRDFIRRKVAEAERPSGSKKGGGPLPEREKEAGAEGKPELGSGSEAEKEAEGEPGPEKED